MSLILALTMALTSPQQTTAAEWLQRLRREPFEQTRPRAVVIRDREFGSSTAVSVYETTLPGDDGRAELVWRARREQRDDGGSRVDWASTSSCAPLFNVVVALERLATPHVELHRPSPTPPPLMGALHQSHLLWVTAWGADNAPVQMTLESLGSGEPKRVYDLIDAQLAACWSWGGDGQQGVD